MKNSAHRIEEIDFLKGYAIILVVIGHIIVTIADPENYNTNPLFLFCYSFHMPLFMFLSGYTVARTKSWDMLGINWGGDEQSDFLSRMWCGPLYIR